MTRRGRGLALAAASVASIAAAAIGGASMAHAAVPRQVGGITWTSTAPGTATGLMLSFRFQNSEDLSLKPHAVAKMVVHSPVGAVTDTTVPPQCHASDAQLMLQGPDGCPADTKIGHAVAVGDTGNGPPFPRYTTTHITNFNNQDEVIGVGVNDDIPAIKPVDHTKIHGNTTTTNFPAIPGKPPPDSYTAFKSLDVVFARYVRAGRAYMRTPPTCPAARYWTFTVEFTYRDGVTQQLVSHSPCKPRHRKPKPRKPPKHRHPECRDRDDQADCD